eukprot:GEMP01033690.1.p1 GENE.GEMP01033690.1~~GEMP01033690.1.p1  ORF type:complete len:334 (-),score=81.36 GEMP01033690.1:938-1939(-)
MSDVRIRYMNGSEVSVGSCDTVLTVKLRAAALHNRMYPEIATICPTSGNVLSNPEVPPDVVQIVIRNLMGDKNSMELERLWKVFLVHAACKELFAALRVLTHAADILELPMLLNRLNERFYHVVQTNDTVVAECLLLLNVAHANDIVIRNMFFDGRALGVAIKEGHEDMVKLLLHWKANINDVWRGWLMGSARSSFGWNERAPALFYAAHCGHNALLPILLATEGCDVNQQAGANGTTALMHCAASNNAEGVKLLLCHGADIDLVTEDGKTAVMEAEELGHEMIVALLRGKRKEPVECTIHDDKRSKRWRDLPLNQLDISADVMCNTAKRIRI